MTLARRAIIMPSHIANANYRDADAWFARASVSEGIPTGESIPAAAADLAAQAWSMRLLLNRAAGEPLGMTVFSDDAPAAWQRARDALGTARRAA